MKFREHRGAYMDSMATVVEIADHAALVDHIRSMLAPYRFEFDSRLLRVKPYGGIDSRNGWDTYIVTIDGFGVVGFTDGPCNATEKP